MDDCSYPIDDQIGSITDRQVMHVYLTRHTSRILSVSSQKAVGIDVRRRRKRSSVGNKI
jgi:hypothetical protein